MIIFVLLTVMVIFLFQWIIRFYSYYIHLVWYKIIETDKEIYIYLLSYIYFILLYDIKPHWKVMIWHPWIHKWRCRILKGCQLSPDNLVLGQMAQGWKHLSPCWDYRCSSYSRSTFCRQGSSDHRDRSCMYIKLRLKYIFI